MMLSKDCVPPKLTGIIADSMPAFKSPGPAPANHGYPCESFIGVNLLACIALNQKCTMQVRKTNNAPLCTVFPEKVENATFWCVQRYRLRCVAGAL
jgi:hypothetical protein